MHPLIKRINHHSPVLATKIAQWFSHSPIKERAEKVPLMERVASSLDLGISPLVVTDFILHTSNYTPQTLWERPSVETQALMEVTNFTEHRVQPTPEFTSYTMWVSQKELLEHSQRP